MWPGVIERPTFPKFRQKVFTRVQAFSNWAMKILILNLVSSRIWAFFLTVNIFQQARKYSIMYLIIIFSIKNSRVKTEEIPSIPKPETIIRYLNSRRQRRSYTEVKQKLIFTPTRWTGCISKIPSLWFMLPILAENL